MTSSEFNTNEKKERKSPLHPPILVHNEEERYHLLSLFHPHDFFFILYDKGLSYFLTYVICFNLLPEFIVSIKLIEDILNE